MAEVLRLNSRGVAHMDWYLFAEAVEAFEKLVEYAPDWIPGRINLGIALVYLGRGSSGDVQQDALQRAERLFEEVLAKEPNNPYAHFNLGWIALQMRGQWEKAIPHFEKVTQLDPDDADTWCYLGQSYLNDPDRAEKCYRRAYEINPCHSGALYQLQMKLREKGELAEADRLLTDWQALQKEDIVATPYNDKFYHERSRSYGQVIGRGQNSAVPASGTGPLPLFQRDDRFKVELPDGVRWATAADLGMGPVAELRRRVRDRFGGTIVCLDYDDDAQPDLLLLGAVVDKGQVRDLLLHNEGGGRFRDVTAQLGLASPRPSLGCCVADYDNDRRPDLLITGAGEPHLFRNTGKGTFEDVTVRAGFDKLTTVCLGATLVDLDQDGDLDVLVAQYAPTPEQALVLLDGKAQPSNPGLVVFLNVAEARPRTPSEDPPPLVTAFRRAEGPAELLGGPAAGISLTITDLDRDRDVDALIFQDGPPTALLLNDRLLRFHRATLPDTLLPRGRANGALVLDVNNDEQSDLCVVLADAAPVLLVHEAVPLTAGPEKWFRKVSTNSPPLLQARALDIDFDGWMDVVGLSNDRKPILLHNDGRTLVHLPDSLGADSSWPKDLLAVTASDLDDDGYADVLLWSERDGLLLQRSCRNSNHGLKLTFWGHRRVEPAGAIIRCNADGLGVRLVAQAGNHVASAEYTTMAAGLGQSAEPLLVGIGKRGEVDVLRLFWTDHATQAVLNLPAVPDGRLVRIGQEYRKVDSCPLLFTWNGQRFVYVTDFLGAGTVGEALVDGGHRPPRPEESVKIEPEQMAPRNGQYVLKIAEPMNEVTYLDRLRLVVVDHPGDVRVYPDERFPGAGPPPTQELLPFRESLFPVQARDHRGRDMTRTLQAWDRDTVDGFSRRTWAGLAEEHFMELDFGDRLARFGAKDRLYLFLAGWTDYPYPDSLWAAHQAGFTLVPPVLERKGDDGRWHKVAEASFPAGLPRMMTLDVTGLLTGPRCVLRLRTNMNVFWDQAFVAPVLGTGTVRDLSREVAAAILGPRPVIKEYSPDGREPTVFDYDRLDAFPVVRPSGRLTRYGEVTELLRTTDDRFVIFGPGDDLEVRFDARDLPPLPAGWKRSYVLRTWGYCKDCAPFTAHGGTVEPLPFRGMSNYPYGPGEKHPDPEYHQKWNTRQVGARREGVGR
jgi:Tfp pilus assembly protein PilF